MSFGIEWFAASLMLTTAPVAEPGPDAPLGRVSSLEGQLFVFAEDEPEAVELTVNSVLRAGDALSVPPGSWVELELDGWAFVHLAGGSALDLAAAQGRVVVSVHEGALVGWTDPRGRAALELRGLGARVNPEAGAVVRLDVARDRLSGSVVCHDGRASLTLGDDEETLAAAEGLWLQPGRRERLAAAELGEDALDRWSQARRAQVERAGDVDAELLGGWELDGRGDWLVVDGRRCFRPAVDVAWRPYHAGGWAWVEPWGWVWTPTESWEFVTHHYGRWYLHNVYGWLWVPVPGWGPAFVSWTLVGPYAGWAPLDPWGYSPAYAAGWATAWQWWFFVELGYFYAGGGCPRHGQTTVVVDVDVTVIAGGGPTPVDPDTELAPDGSPRVIDREQRARLAARELHQGTRRLDEEQQDRTQRLNPPRLTPPRPAPPADAHAAAQPALARPSYSGVTTTPRRPSAPAVERARPASVDRRPIPVPRRRTVVTVQPSTPPRTADRPASARPNPVVIEPPSRSIPRQSLPPPVRQGRPSRSAPAVNPSPPPARWSSPAALSSSPRSAPAVRSSPQRSSPAVAPSSPPPQAKPVTRSGAAQETKRESVKESRAVRR